MKTKNILVAFLLNLFFAGVELMGGLLTGSVAIVSDALHDLGDAAGIGVSYLLEKKSTQPPDETYTYGYARYSVLGSAMTTLILLLGSVMVIYHAVHRILNPVEIHYQGMILLAVMGVCVNAAAAFFTHGDGSLNQKAVNLHMLEDVLGWVVVLLGAVVMRFTGFVWIDPLLSIAVAVFIFAHAIGNMKEALSVFLEKTPEGLNAAQIRGHLLSIGGVVDVHHVHLWSLDGRSHCATLHLVTNAPSRELKEAVRRELRAHGIDHVTLELEAEGEHCHEPFCRIRTEQKPCCHHHH